jgi:hypothetical protein
VPFEAGSIALDPSLKSRIFNSKIDPPPPSVWEPYRHHAEFSARSSSRLIAALLPGLNVLFTGADPIDLLCPEVADSAPQFVACLRRFSFYRRSMD